MSTEKGTIMPSSSQQDMAQNDERLGNKIVTGVVIFTLAAIITIIASWPR